MADTTLAAGAATTNYVSLIKQLHAKWEAAWLAHETIGLEGMEIPENDPRPDRRLEKVLWGEAEQQGLRQIVALQQAILHQAPETWEDALILLLHIRDLFESVSDGGDDYAAKLEREAVAVAIDALFNFMATERQEVDHEAVGPYFHRVTLQSWAAAHKRAGIVE